MHNIAREKASREAGVSRAVEFKLASNHQLKRILEKQTAAYEAAEINPPPHPSIKVIMYFTEREEEKVRKILAELKMTDDPNLVLINARNDDKPSGSKA